MVESNHNGGCGKMNQSPAYRDDRATVSDPDGHARAGILMRICLPMILWAIVGIGAPAFFRDLYRNGRDMQEDFAVYYVLGQELRQGVNPYTTDFTSSARLGGFNIHAVSHGSDPPTFLMLIADPLSRLPVRTGYWIWQVANLACLVIAVYLLVGQSSGLAFSTGLSLIALTALYPAVVTHIWMGQSKLPALLLLVLTMRWMERQHDRLAGLTLAFASLLRFFPLVLCGYLLLQRRCRMFIYTGIGILLGSAVTIALAGVHNCTSFITVAASLVHDRAADTGRDIAVNMFISRQLHAVWPFSSQFAASAARVLNIGADLLVLSATTRATLTLPPADDPDSRLYSLWVATSIVLLPIVWDYDLTLMLIPFAVLILVAARGEASRRAITMAVLSYILLIFWDYLTPTRHECGFLSMLAAYLSAYWLVVDQPRAVAVPIRAMPAEIWRRLVPTT